jgi:thiamine kinase-like enzyme
MFAWCGLLVSDAAGPSARSALPVQNGFVSAPTLSPLDLDRIERALGWRPTQWAPASARKGGATAARLLVSSGDERAFVKLGTTELTAGWFRREHENYLALDGPFLPRLLGFSDDGIVPVLAIEDLSDATWPPPWDDEKIAQVLDAAALVHAHPVPSHLAAFMDEYRDDWDRVASDPHPFLALGLCSGAWLERAVPVLSAAAWAAPIRGSALLHVDLRSDNLCFRDGRALIIDWDGPMVGNPDLDIAAWLPSLAAEGGPQPEAIMPAAPELAAWIAGYFCARAGLEPIPEASHVRPLQLAHARTSLPWAARALGLPVPG